MGRRMEAWRTVNLRRGAAGVVERVGGIAFLYLTSQGGVLGWRDGWINGVVVVG